MKNSLKIAGSDPTLEPLFMYFHHGFFHFFLA
jgi:hypothetical protein